MVRDWSGRRSGRKPKKGGSRILLPLLIFRIHQIKILR